MSPPISELNPDYVLAVQYPLESPSSGLPTTQAKKNLTLLVEKLHSNGFLTQIRPGTSTPSTLLVFIKLTSYKYAEEAEKDLIQNYEFGVTAKIETVADHSRIVYRYLTAPELVGGLGVNPGAGPWLFVNSVFPITEAFDNSKTITEHVKTHLSASELTTSNIKDKYGVQVALYFEFLKYYTTWLVFLVVVGITLYLKLGKIFLLLYSFINLVWGVFFIGFWERRQRYLANCWGVQNSHLVDEHNAELAQINKLFESKSSYLHKDNSDAYRFIRQMLFIPVAAIFAAVLVLYQLLCFTIEIFLTDVYDGPGKSFLTLIPTILISVFVPILTIVYNIVSDAAISWENHDSVYSRDRSQLIKTFVLNFLTSYMPLLITSFVYLPYAHLVQPHLGDIKDAISANVAESRFFYKYLIKLKKQEDFKMNQERLNAQFFYFIVTNQVIQLILKYVLPLIITKASKLVKDVLNKGKEEYEIVDNEEEKVFLEDVRHVLDLPVYNVNDDFRSLVVQYGYLVMFGPVWTIAPLICLIFNIIVFKLDTIRLAKGTYFKPPVPSRVDSIHPWNYALFLLTWVGSIVSPLITAFYRHGTKPPKTLGQFAFDKASVNVSSTARLMFILFVSEHGFFILNYFINKFNSFFKSEVEWKNDFVDNDIKLRHDYYSDKVKPHYVPDDHSAWATFSAEESIESASKLPLKKVIHTEASPATTAPSHSGPTPIPETKSEAYLTAAKTNITEVQQRGKNTAKSVAENVTATVSETERVALEKVKDFDDTIIKSKNTLGEEHLATIDNNKHIPVENVTHLSEDAKAAIHSTTSEATKAVDKLSDSVADVEESVGDAVDDVDDADVTVDSTIDSTAESNDYQNFINETKKNVEEKATKKRSLKKLFKNKK